MKTIKKLLLIIIVFGLLSACSKHQIISKNDCFYIINKSNQPLIFIYQINGDELNTERTDIIFPGESYEVFKTYYDYHGTEKKIKKIKKIKIVGSYNVSPK